MELLANPAFMAVAVFGVCLLGMSKGGFLGLGVMALPLMSLYVPPLQAAAIILPLYYLADATITILRRIARREKIWQAHRQHFYQRAVAGGLTHARVSLMIALANAALIGLAILSREFAVVSLIGAALVTSVLLATLQRRAPAS